MKWGLALELTETFGRGHVSQTIDVAVEYCVVNGRLCSDCQEAGRGRAGARCYQGSGQARCPQPDRKRRYDVRQLVVVNVIDYRYISIGARVMFGIMTGNAFINAQVGFRDLKTGETWATQTYDTKSSAWNGVFAAMTTKQVRAMCHEILGEVSAH